MPVSHVVPAVPVGRAGTGKAAIEGARLTELANGSPDAALNRLDSLGTDTDPFGE